MKKNQAPLITVVIPVKNEEVNLSKCLSSLISFSEVVVVDSSSIDRTKEIAVSFSRPVMNFEWNGEFPKKRNWVLRNYDFKTDWVLFLDADESLPGEFAEAAFQAVSNTSKVGYWLRYNNYFQGKLLRYGIPFRKLTLFRVDAGEYERIDEVNWSNLDMEIHEHPVLQGEIGEIAEPIIHEDYKNLYHYIARHNEYSSWEARRYLDLKTKKDVSMTSRQVKKYRYINTIWWSPLYFFVNYFVKKGFLDGNQGLNHSLFKMIYFFEIRCKIRELQRQ